MAMKRSRSPDPDDAPGAARSADSGDEPRPALKRSGSMRDLAKAPVTALPFTRSGLSGCLDDLGLGGGNGSTLFAPLTEHFPDALARAQAVVPKAAAAAAVTACGWVPASFRRGEGAIEESAPASSSEGASSPREERASEKCRDSARSTQSPFTM